MTLATGRTLAIVTLMMFLPWGGALAAQSFTDGAFAGWTSSKIVDTTSGATATVVASVDTVAGNPAPSRRVVHTYGTGQISAAHLHPSAFYEPATMGSIGSLSYSYDARHFSPPAGQAVAYALLVLQNGTYYRGPIDNVLNDTWQTFSRAGLKAQDFVRLLGSGPVAPDFSCAGGRLQLGYLTANSNPNAGFSSTRTSGIDNWKVSVNDAQPCCEDLTVKLQYTAKFFCHQAVEEPLQLVAGFYATTLNVHNPSFCPAGNCPPVRFAKKVAIARPGQTVGPISKFRRASLRPDEAFQVDCADILRLAGVEPGRFLDGFVVIESEGPLDITAVYSARPGGGQVSALDVEQARERSVTGVLKVCN